MQCLRLLKDNAVNQLTIYALALPSRTKLALKDFKVGLMKVIILSSFVALVYGKK